MGLVTLIVGSIYFFTILLARKQHPRDALVVVRYVLTAIVLLVLATTIQFSGFTTVIYWALEAFFLVWCGARWRLAYVWKAALGLFGIATIHFLLTRGALSYDPIGLFSPLLNQRTFAFSVLTAAIGASTLFFVLQAKAILRISRPSFTTGGVSFSSGYARSRSTTTFVCKPSGFIRPFVLPLISSAI